MVMLPHLFRNFFVPALDSIMDFLCDFEKFFIAFYDFPSRLDTKVFEYRDHTLQYFRDTSARPCRIHMEERLFVHPRTKYLQHRKIAFGRDT
jgi:hypothetical protein